MGTPRFPASIPANYYGNPPQHMMAVLLAPSVTSLPGTVDVLSDVSALEIAAGGNYTPANGAWGSTLAVQLPDFVYKHDDSAGKSEISAPTSIVISNNFFTVSFRWIVISSDIKIISAIDYGSTQTLTSQPLVLTIPASPDIASSWPIMRWNRVGS